MEVRDYLPLMRKFVENSLSFSVSQTDTTSFTVSDVGSFVCETNNPSRVDIVTDTN